MIASRTSIGALRRELAARIGAGFAARGYDGTPSLDARLLLAHALGSEAETLALRDDEAVPPGVGEAASSLAERRIAGEPVARIIGRKGFWTLDLVLGPDTLVPRPDTETLIEAALRFIDASGRRNEPLRLLDIGTGSGAILLALLSELPHAFGIGTDWSVGALETARANAAQLGLGERAGFVCCDWAAALAGPFDLVLSNPPYIESAVISSLPMEIRTFDPHLALDGGPDGLAAYRAIVSDLDRLLATDGAAFFETGWDQVRQVSDIAASFQYETKIHRDLGGIDRVVELHQRKR